MDQNRRFAELCGVIPYKAHGGYERNDYPDYAADPRLVLREMVKYGKWGFFVSPVSLMMTINGVTGYYISLDLILDTTGKLRDMAIKFLEGKNE